MHINEWNKRNVIYKQKSRNEMVLVEMTKIKKSPWMKGFGMNYIVSS